jgi:hypothetical protein
VSLLVVIAASLVFLDPGHRHLRNHSSPVPAAATAGDAASVVFLS